jgi:hypothetical protein
MKLVYTIVTMAKQLTASDLLGDLVHHIVDMGTTPVGADGVDKADLCSAS